MIKNSFNEEYKAPKCKVVSAKVQNLVCTSFTNGNIDYAEEEDLGTL